MHSVVDLSRRAWQRVTRLPAAMRYRAAELRRPESHTRTIAVQTAKATLAAVVAWYVAANGFGGQAAWLAPVTAVLMVQSTGYRSVVQGLKRVIAVAAGAAIAAGAGATLGLGVLGLLVVVPLSLLGARVRWIGAQGEYITVTAVILLAFGVATDQNFLISYFIDTAIGATVGAGVNLLLFPPAYQRSTRTAVGDLGRDTAEVLRDVAEGARTRWNAQDAERWYDRATRLEDQAQAAQTALEWNREGLKWNPWHRRDRSWPPQRYQPAIDALWHIAIETRSLTRTMRDDVPEPDEQDTNGGLLTTEVPPVFDDLAPLLESVAEVVETFGKEPALPREGLSEPVLSTLHHAEQLHADLSERLPDTGVTKPGPYAAAGSVLDLLGRIPRHLRDLHG